MAEYSIVFRFVGRFVFAQDPANPGSLSALAINTEHCRDVSTPSHCVSMSIPCGRIHPLASRPPDFRFLSSASTTPQEDEMGLIEQGIWHLDDHVAHINGKTPFQWGDHHLIPEFEALVPSGNKKIATSAAKTLGGPTAAIIQLRCGTGVARQMVQQSVELVKLQDAIEPVKATAVTLADVVEVTVVTTGDPFFIRLCPGKSTAAGSVAVLTEDDRPTLVTFSNICTGSTFENFDKEFATLYEVLEEPPRTGDRLVPRRVNALNGRIDCHSPILGEFDN
jgi:hypothetical protein